MILHNLAGIAIFFYHLQQLLCTGACTVPLFTVGSRIPNDVRSAPGVCAVPDPAETAGLPMPDSRTNVKKEPERPGSFSLSLLLAQSAMSTQTAQTRRAFGFSPE